MLKTVAKCGIASVELISAGCKDHAQRRCEAGVVNYPMMPVAGGICLMIPSKV